MEDENFKDEENLENEDNEKEIEEQKSESILCSVKKLLGINNMDDFDQDIIIHINSAISVLKQLGVEPNKNFIVTGKEQTYADYLGENSEEVSMVKQYIYCKVRKIFDPPSNGSIMSALEETIKELEWRLNIQVDPKETFQEESNEE